LQGPEARELVDFGPSADRTGEVVVDRLREGGERRRAARRREDEVVRRGAQRRAHGLVVLGRDPEARARPALRRVANAGGDAEDEVVAGLVRKQQRSGVAQERSRVLDPPHDHSSSSTSTAPPATCSPSETWSRRTTPSYGETSGVSIFIASRTTSGWRGWTRSPSPTSTRITVPGIGATSALCSAPERWICPATSSSGGACGGGGGRFRRKGPRQGAGAGIRGRDSAGFSTRNAVVVSPARSCGCATSQRRNGRFVTTPPTSVSASAAASRSSASARVPPCAISLAIIGSYAIPTSSPSSTPASTRTALGSRSRSSLPVCGRNVFGSSA